MKSVVVYRDPKGQGTPHGLQNARAAKRIRKADMNICGEGRAESIGFFIPRDPRGQGTPPLDGVPEKTLVLGTQSDP